MTTEIRPSAAHQRPSGKLYLGTDQLNLVNGAMTLVELDTISAGFTDGIEDIANHRITPGVAGFYDVKGQVYFKDVVADTRYIASIRVNGVTTLFSACHQASIVGYLSAACSGHCYLAATDYVELMAQSLSGNNTVDILSAEFRTFLSVQRIR
jgi:hypothetical protein